MSAYIVATVRISDPERFALYSKGIAGLSERFGGEAVVKGAVAEVLEGDGMVGERVEHADRLGALSRKYERKFHDVPDRMD